MARYAYDVVETRLPDCVENYVLLLNILDNRQY